MPARTAAFASTFFVSATLAALLLAGCTKCRGRTFHDHDWLPGQEVTVSELREALGQEQSLQVLWDYESTFPEYDSREMPFTFPPYPYAEHDTLTVRIVLKGDFEEYAYDSEDGRCDDPGPPQAPARAILRSESGEFDAELEIAVIPGYLGVNNGRITSPTGRLADYLDSLELPEGASREFSMHVDYDDRGLIEHAALQVDVDYLNARYSRVIFAGGRAQFEE